MWASNKKLCPDIIASHAVVLGELFYPPRSYDSPKNDCRGGYRRYCAFWLTLINGAFTMCLLSHLFSEPCKLFRSNYNFFLFIFRIFSHPNVLPVIGAVNDSKNLIVLSQYLPFGSLYNILHEGTGG